MRNPDYRRDELAPNGGSTHITNNYGSGKSGIGGTALGTIIGAVVAGTLLATSGFYGSQEIDRRTHNQVASNTQSIQTQEREIGELNAGLGAIVEDVTNNREAIEQLRRGQGGLEREVSQNQGTSGLFIPQECSVAQMRGLNDTLNFFDRSGEYIGTINQVNWENNSPDSFGERVVRELRSNVLDPTGIYNAVSLTFHNPNGNDFRVAYSPRNPRELVGFLNEYMRGDCVEGVYDVTVEGMANISTPQIQRAAPAAQPQRTQTPAAPQRATTTDVPQRQGCLAPDTLSVGGVPIPGQGSRNCN